MNSIKTIEQPNRLDPRRKLLMKELESNIAKQSTQTPKRKPSHQYDDYCTLDTLKKKNHSDHNFTNLQYQSLRNVVLPRQIQFPIKDNISQTDKDNHQQHPQYIDKSLQVLEENNQREEHKLQNFTIFEHKMFDLGVSSIIDSNLLSEKERMLISIQQKLDDYLVFLKENRKKKKGQCFGIIKKHFLQIHRIFLEFSHVKKIIFLDSDLYLIQKIGNGLETDFLIDIKVEQKENTIDSAEVNYKDRKRKFRTKLQGYVLMLKTPQDEDKFEIPEVKFEFEQNWQQSKNVLKQNIKQIFNGQLLNKKKIDKFFVLRNKASKKYLESKQILAKGIKKVQTIIQKQKSIDLTQFGNKMFIKKLLPQSQLDSIIEEINTIYRNKNVTNILFSQLVDSLSKRIILSQDIFAKVVQIFSYISFQINDSKMFLKIIDHKGGKLVQVDRNLIKQFKNTLFSNPEWMKMFQFSIQMSEQTKKIKIQQKRQMLIKQQEELNPENKQNLQNILQQRMGTDCQIQLRVLKQKQKQKKKVQTQQIKIKQDNGISNLGKRAKKQVLEQYKINIFKKVTEKINKNRIKQTIPQKKKQQKVKNKQKQGQQKSKQKKQIKQQIKQQKQDENKLKLIFQQTDLTLQQMDQKFKQKKQWKFLQLQKPKVEENFIFEDE